VLRYAGPVALTGSLNYSQLTDQVTRFAAALHALGVRKGDRVALMLPNVPQFIIGFFGTIKLGAIAFNANPLHTARELELQFADAGVENVVLLSGHYAKLREVQARTAVKRVIVTDVTDYTPPIVRLAAARTLRHDGLQVNVPDGPGVYHFRPLLAAHPEAPRAWR